MTRVVIAPDKFKGSLTAVAAAEAIALGVRDALPDADIAACPVADGGEGTLEVLENAGGELVRLSVRGPLEDHVDARYVVLDGTAYIESARACGIEFVDPTPETALAAHTWGVGELLGDALSRGASRLVLTVGGTASTDGGAGMLAALGAGVFDAFDAPIGLGGGTLSRVAKVELGPARERLGTVPITVATDVTNPLVGPDGAAAVFGPQKGARPHEVTELDTALGRWAQTLVNAGAPDVSAVPARGPAAVSRAAPSRVSAPRSRRASTSSPVSPASTRLWSAPTSSSRAKGHSTRRACRAKHPPASPPGPLVRACR